MFMVETSKMVEKSYQLIQSRKTQTYAYITVTDPEYIRPMFEVTWGAMLALFSILLEQNDE